MARICPQCQQDLPQEAYQPSAWRKGRGNPCRNCSKLTHKAYRVKNYGKLRAGDKLKYLRHREATRARDYRKKYGLLLSDIDDIFNRQHGRCLGCFENLTIGNKRGERYHVDHNHLTNKVRGLLCPACNTTLGLVKENTATLRRLIAYLDYDRSKLLVYLIGALKNTRVPIIGNLLRTANYDVMDEWFTPGEHADENWQKYEKLRGRTYTEALKGRAATNIFLFDKAYLDLADVAILIMPAGKSAMLELGYAKGTNKYTCIFLDGQDPDRYDIMPNFADKVLTTKEELLQWLATINVK